MKELVKDILIDMLISVKDHFFISCFVTFIIFAIWFIFYSIRCREKNMELFTLRKVKTMLFSFSIIGCYMMLFFETIYSRAPHSRDSLALIFYFENILRDFESGKFAIENIFLFIPVGFLWGGVLKRKALVTKVTFLSFATSLTIETTQLLTGRGFFQISDLITNTTGGFIGAIAYLMIRYILNIYKNYDKE